MNVESVAEAVRRLNALLEDQPGGEENPGAKAQLHSLCVMIEGAADCDSDVISKAAEIRALGDALYSDAQHASYAKDPIDGPTMCRHFIHGAGRSAIGHARVAARRADAGSHR